MITDVLIQKSQENHQVAKQLLGEGKLVPVAHCTYYSLLQTLKSFVLANNGMTYEQYEILLDEKGSHIKIMVDAGKILKRKGVKSADITNLWDHYNFLKKERKKSDYSNELVDKIVLEEALTRLDICLGIVDNS